MTRVRETARSSVYSWVVAFLLLVVWLLSYLDRQLVFSVLPLVQQDLRLSSLQLGLIGTAFLWTYAVCSPLTGYMADRVGCKPLICGSLFVWSLLTLCTAFTGSYAQLVSLRVLLGVSEACFLPAALSLLAAYHPGRTRSRAMALLYSGNYPGLVLGGVLGGALGSAFGWRFGFRLFGTLGCCYAISLMFTLKEPREGAESQPFALNSGRSFARAACRVFQSAGYPRIFVVFALASFCDWAVYTWMPLYLFEEFRFSLAKAGFSATFYMKTGACLGLFAGGLLSDRYLSTVPLGRARLQAGGLLVAAPFLILAGHTHIDRVLYAAMLLYGIGKGAYDVSIVPLLCEEVPENLRATAIGMLNAAGTFSGGVIAAAAGAAKASYGFSRVLVTCGALLFLAGVLLSLGTMLQRRATSSG